MMRAYSSHRRYQKKMRKIACALALAAAHGLPALRSRVEKDRNKRGSPIYTRRPEKN
jgi:hypothetical protein